MDVFMMHKFQTKLSMIVKIMLFYNILIHFIDFMRVSVLCLFSKCVVANYHFTKKCIIIKIVLLCAYYQPFLQGKEIQDLSVN